MLQTHLFTVCWIVAVLSFDAGISLAEEKKAAGSKPVVSWIGTESHITKARNQRITSSREWIAVWLENQGAAGDAKKYDTEKNVAKVPDVDFSTHMVIAVFEGKTINCSGYSNASWRAGPNGGVFRFNIETYGTFGPGEKVTPYGLFVVPRTEQPISLQIPKPTPNKGDDPSGEWEVYGRIPKLLTIKKGELEIRTAKDKK